MSIDIFLESNKTFEISIRVIDLSVDFLNGAVKYVSEMFFSDSYMHEETRVTVLAPM